MRNLELESQLRVEAPVDVHSLVGAPADLVPEARKKGGKGGISKSRAR